MSIRYYIAILLRRKWIILLTAGAAATIAGIASYLMTPMYAATAVARLASGTAGRVEYADYIYAERLMNTYAQMITSKPVMDQVKTTLGITLLPKVDVEVVRDTELIRITAEGPDPAAAQSVANALAETLKTQSQSLYTGGGKSARDILGDLVTQTENELAQVRAERDQLMAQKPETRDQNQIESLNSTIQLKEQTLALLLTQYENAQLTEAVRANAVSIVEPASLPTEQSKPNKKVNVLLGALSGLIAGVGLAFLFENTDTTLHSTEDVRAVAALPILGQIPAASRSERNNHLLASADQLSVLYEAYRGLRTNLLALGSECKLKSLVITSADRGEGKSTIIANLALTFARAGRRVTLIDADLRLPALHKIFDLPNDVGLSSLLCQEVALDAALHNDKVAGLCVITSGPAPENPTELLESARMKKLIQRLVQQSDVLLIDTPCLLSVTDAAVLGPMVDGVMLVVSRGETRQEDVVAALQQLAGVKANAIGIIVNRSENGRKYYHSGNRRRLPAGTR